MNENKGSKGGSRDLRLRRFFLNLLKRKTSLQLEQEKIQLEEIELKKKKILVESNENVVTLLSQEDKKVIETDIKPAKITSKKKKVVALEKIEKAPLKQDIIEKEKEEKQELQGKKRVLSVKPKFSIQNEEYLEELKAFEEISDKKNLTQLTEDAPKENLESIKSTSLEESPVKDLNEKELKEIILEDKLLKTLEETIAFSEYKVKKMLIEEEQLEQETEDLLLKRDCEDTLEKVEELLSQIKKLKQELESIITSSNFDKVYEWDDNYFSLLIDEYKQRFNHNFDLELLENVQKNEDYKHLMERIIEIENETNQLEEKMNEKLDNISKRDKNFLTLTNEFDYADKDFDNVDTMIDDMDKVLKDLEKKVNNAKKVTEQVSYIMHDANHSLDTLILTYLATKNNPLVPKTVGLLLRTQAVLAFIGDLFTPKKERIINRKIEVIDYTKEIKGGLKSLDDVFQLCDETSEKIKNIKQEFMKQFSGYDIPEYKEVFEKLNSLEKNIEERRNYLLASRKEFTKQLEKNKVLIKEKETHEIH